MYLHVSQRTRPPMFAIAACVLCGVAIGFICWSTTLRSDAEPTFRDYLFFFLYECLSVGSYVAALWFFKRLTTFRGTEIIVVLFLVSIFGTTIPYVASSIEIWSQSQLEFGWFVSQSASGWVMLMVATLLMMSVAGTAAFLFSLSFRQTGPQTKTPDIGDARS